jgi:predicted acetyltransferase
MIAIGIARQYPELGSGARPIGGERVERHRRAPLCCPAMNPAPVTRDELREFAKSIWAAFHEDMSDDDAGRWERVLEPERTLAIRDGGRIVAGCGIFSRRLAVPGGVVPAAGVTLVGVRPTHRRRGLMSSMMRRLLNDVHDKGREAVVILWASEPVIYGRFGYGLGTNTADLRVASGSARMRSTPDARVDLLTPAEALPAMRELHEAVWPTIPGMVDRDGPWWEDRIEDPEEHREGLQPLRAIVTDGAYALYQVRRRWNEDGPDSEVVVSEALAATPEAEAAIWSYLLGLDLTRRISWELAPPDHPMMHMVTNAQDVKLTLGYGLWVRLVDVPRALAQRAYGEPFELVLEVEDDVCPWNAGRWALRWDGTTATCAATATPASLALSSTELGAAYLGGTRLTTLAQAGRVKELRPGAVAAASRAFAGDRAPWCLEIF